MAKIKVDDHTQRGNDIQLEQIEIVTDSANHKRIEIYILDNAGDRIEGGTFDAEAFMAVVRKFYQENY